MKAQSSRGEEGEIEAKQRSRAAAALGDSKVEREKAIKLSRQREEGGEKEHSKVESKGGKMTQHLNRARTQEKVEANKGQKSRACAGRNRKHAQELKYETVQTN